MSVRIALDNPPEFYTNLDFISGRVIVSLNRPEAISGIIVKLEGESNTSLAVSLKPPPGSYSTSKEVGEVLSESHKVLYKVQQVYPNPDAPCGSYAGPYYPLQPGTHQFSFKFKLTLNNICGRPEEMIKLGGITGVGGLGAGVRVMDGSRQLMYAHIQGTLPPSFTGFPRKAEVRYYLKATIQRPGLFKENWRYRQGLKFLPFEPPRPKPTKHEAFARRPFTFRPRSPAPQSNQRSSLFSKTKGAAAPGSDSIPPSIELSARLPHPTILTCNQPIPLRLVAKKLLDSPEEVFISSLEITLIGLTRVRSHTLRSQETTRWVVCSQSGTSIPVATNPEDQVGTETTVSDAMWRGIPLPNTVTPSFIACNLARVYQLELKIGLTWGNPKPGENDFIPQTIYLPLHFSRVDVFSGIKPPPALLEATANNSTPTNVLSSLGTFSDDRPPLPARLPTNHAQRPVPVVPAQPIDPLYPPQLGTPQAAQYGDAPPSYDEAMAETMTGPVNRPAYSGQTNENAPSLINNDERKR